VGLRLRFRADGDFETADTGVLSDLADCVTVQDRARAAVVAGASERPAPIAFDRRHASEAEGAVRGARLGGFVRLVISRSATT
jgi:hypothetical protein